MYHYKCTLDRVVDGDTIDAIIDLGFNITIKKRIRLYGIDAPETRTRDKVEKSKGIISKMRLIQLLEDNNNIFMLRSVEAGKYGRCIGILYLDELETKSVNTILIEEGLADPYEK